MPAIPWVDYVTSGEFFDRDINQFSDDYSFGLGMSTYVDDLREQELQAYLDWLNTLDADTRATIESYYAGLGSGGAAGADVTATDLNEILYELRQNPVFAGFDEAAQQRIAAVVATEGLDAAVRQVQNAILDGTAPANAGQWVQAAQNEIQYAGQGAEERLFNQAYSDYALPDIARDTQRQAYVQQLLSQYQPLFDQSRQTIADIITVDDGSTGSRLYNQELAASGLAADQQQAALDAELATMGLSQDQINAARLRAATGQATALNLATQSERDRIMADAARRGYVGSSTGVNNALFRAGLAGRQQAANAMSDARLANTSESGALANYGANERRGISDAASARQLNYFSNDIQRRLQALSLPAAAVQQEMQVQTMGDQYGQSGLNNALNTLGWWKIGSSQASDAVSQPGVQTDNAMGSAMQNLGAGIVGLAGSYANANNWWSSGNSGATGGVYGQDYGYDSYGGLDADGNWTTGG